MKLIEAKQAKEFAQSFFADPVLRMAVNAVVDNAPGFDLVHCKDCFADGCCSIQIDLEMGGEGYCPKGKRRTDEQNTL